jgi:RNA polymerase sigma-70 factor (ECF subfamily)
MNKEEFTERVETMRGTLYGMARTYLQSPYDCADAVQEAVLKAWKSLSSLRHHEHFETWAVRILINECKSILRRAKRTVLMADLPDSPIPHGAEPEVYEAVYSLDIRYRSPFILHHVEGYSVLEIAQMLRLPKGTVTSRLQRARRILQQIVGGDLV